MALCNENNIPIQSLIELSNVSPTLNSVQIMLNNILKIIKQKQVISETITPETTIQYKKKFINQIDISKIMISPIISEINNIFTFYYKFDDDSIINLFYIYGKEFSSLSKLLSSFSNRNQMGSIYNQNTNIDFLLKDRDPPYQIQTGSGLSNETKMRVIDLKSDSEDIYFGQRYNQLYYLLLKISNILEKKQNQPSDRFKANYIVDKQCPSDAKSQIRTEESDDNEAQNIFMIAGIIVVIIILLFIVFKIRNNSL